MRTRNSTPGGGSDPRPAPGGWRAAISAARLPLGAALVVGAFFLLLLAKNPLLCWKDDFAISILPVLLDSARSVEHGEWPLLSPSSWACGNLAGEYQYGTFSPCVQLVVRVVGALPLSLPAKAAALALPHLLVMAAGASLLARRYRASNPGAVLVAIVATLNGWNIAWGATNWFGALAANAWLPWCWWAFEGALAPAPHAAETTERQWLRQVAIPTVCVFLLITGGFPYTVGMLALVLVWLALREWTRQPGIHPGVRLLTLWPLALGGILGVGLAAPAWLSLLQYMLGSDRAHGANVVATAWAVPWTALPGLVLPNWHSAWADFAGRLAARDGVELAGGFVPVVLLAAHFKSRAARTNWREHTWEIGLVLAVLMLCMLPSPGMFRWSFRWLPLFFLALPLCACRLSIRSAGETGESAPGATEGRTAVIVAGLVCATMWVCGTHGEAPTRLPEATLLLAGCWLLAAMFLPGRLAAWLPPGVALASLWITFGILPTNPGVPVYAFGENLLAPAPLSPGHLYLGLYQPPFLCYRDFQTGADFGALVRPGSTPMLAGLHFINGYSPIMSDGIGRRLEMETHGFVPEHVGARLLATERGPDNLLTRLGIDGLVIAYDYPRSIVPDAADWRTVAATREGTVYHRRTGVSPPIRAWNSATPGGPEHFGPVRLTGIDERQRVVVAEVDVPAGGKPALLLYRRPFFPGYRATLNGRPLPVGSFQGLVPTVELPPGSHGHLQLFYLPWTLVVGTIMFLLASTALPLVHRIIGKMPVSGRSGGGILLPTAD